MLRVSNVGTVPAFSVIIDGFPHGIGAMLDDNGFGLLPGETRSIGVRTADGAVPRLAVRAWNADGVSAGGLSARRFA
jgi:hypothetical protein